MRPIAAGSYICVRLHAEHTLPKPQGPRRFSGDDPLLNRCRQVRWIRRLIRNDRAASLQWMRVSVRGVLQTPSVCSGAGKQLTFLVRVEGIPVSLVGGPIPHTRRAIRRAIRQRAVSSAAGAVERGC